MKRMDQNRNKSRRQSEMVERTFNLRGHLSFLTFVKSHFLTQRFYLPIAEQRGLVSLCDQAFFSTILFAFCDVWLCLGSIYSCDCHFPPFVIPLFQNIL